MSHWSGAHRSFAVEQYLKNGESLVRARRTFCTHFNIRRLSDGPSTQLIWSWVQRFRQEGTTLNRAPPGPSTSVATPERVSEVQNEIIRNPRKSIRKIAASTGIKKSTVQWVQKLKWVTKEEYEIYRVTVEQSLGNAAVEAYFCNEFSLRKAQRKFCNRYEIRRLSDAPSVQLIKSWVEKFRVTGCLLNHSIGPRSRPVRSIENIDRVAAAVAEHPRRSVRKHAASLNLHRSSEIESISFSSVSPCLRHDAFAVFAHLKVALVHMINHQQIKVLHIVSDGPSSQYKNKNNIYLFTQHLVHILGITEATWNVTERSHGKGPADRVGAAIKETANKYVLGGNDIPDYSTFLQVFKSKSNDLLYEECQSEIESAEELLKTAGQLKIIPGVKNCHQITWNRQDPRTVHLRDLTQFVLH
ncbi:hypothetical protein ACJJTC_019178 [Scirpophaga incertulas]